MIIPHERFHIHGHQNTAAALPVQRRRWSAELTRNENQASGRQARRAAFWDAQHTDQYVSNPKSAAQRSITA
jgi:hypothetical protein